VRGLLLPFLSLDRTNAVAIFGVYGKSFDRGKVPVHLELKDPPTGFGCRHISGIQIVLDFIESLILLPLYGDRRSIVTFVDVLVKIFDR